MFYLPKKTWSYEKQMRNSKEKERVNMFLEEVRRSVYSRTTTPYEARTTTLGSRMGTTSYEERRIRRMKPALKRVL
jgi:hypothetical protein